MSDRVAIKVEGVTKSFRLPHEKHGSVKSLLLNSFKAKRTYEKQSVLKNISFEIKEGEFFGIVGRNGSGKSTLLKLLAGIYTPDEGHIHINGKLTPFIELGVGFNPELTGRENVYLNGALLGFSRKEMDEMYDEIVVFAELENFMDQALKNYSSGMQVRLAFSIAIRAKSDILLVDEVLAVGDASFQQKCYETFDLIRKSGTTVILVTHDMSAVSRFCDRALLIKEGKILFQGNPSNVADKYLELNYETKDTDINGDKENVADVEFSNIQLYDKNNMPKKAFSIFEEIDVKFNYKNKLNIPINFGLQIFDENNAYCFGTNTKIAGLEPISPRIASVKLKIKNNLGPGRYHVTLAAVNEGATTVLSYKPKAISFSIKQETQYEGVTLMNHTWGIGDV